MFLKVWKSINFEGCYFHTFLWYFHSPFIQAHSHHIFHKVFFIILQQSKLQTAHALHQTLHALSNLTTCYNNSSFMKSKNISNGFAKSQNKLKYSSQAQKMAPNGWASREAKWVFATVSSHLCLTLFICHFIFLLFCFLKPHSLSLFLFSFFRSALWLSKPWEPFFAPESITK